MKIKNLIKKIIQKKVSSVMLFFTLTKSESKASNIQKDFFLIILNLVEISVYKIAYGPR